MSNLSTQTIAPKTTNKKIKQNLYKSLAVSQRLNQAAIISFYVCLQQYIVIVWQINCFLFFPSSVEWAPAAPAAWEENLPRTRSTCFLPRGARCAAYYSVHTQYGLGNLIFVLVCDYLKRGKGFLISCIFSSVWPI